MNNVWPQIPLGEILTRRKDDVEIQPFNTYERLTIRLNGKGIVLRDKTIGSEIGTKRQFVVKAGQLVLSKIDARNGAFGVLPKEFAGAIITGNFWAFDPDLTRLDPHFLNYLTMTPLFVDFCIRASEGTTNRRYLQQPKFLAQRISLPPVDEQRRIVSRIDKLAAKVEQAHTLRRETAEQVNRIWIRVGETLFDKFPAKDLRRLGDIVEIRGGGTPSKSNPQYWSGATPWISPKDMKTRELFDSIDHISEQAVVETSAKLLPPNCVLVVVRGMILLHTVPAAVLKVPATINQDLKALLPRDGLSPDYLCAVLWALNQRLLALVEKSTHDTRKLETPKLLDFRIPIPSLAEQSAVVAYLENLRAKIGTMRQKQADTGAELHALMPSILSKALRGEL